MLLRREVPRLRVSPGGAKSCFWYGQPLTYNTGGSGTDAMSRARGLAVQ